MKARTAALIAVTVVGLLPAGCGGKRSAAASTPNAVKVDGALGEQRTWTVDQLETLPLTTQDVSYVGMGGNKTVHAKGVPLLDLLNRAKPRFDTKMKHDELRFAVLVHATDKYEATVAWGEMAPDFAAKPVLVEVEEDGKKLDRPSVLVPGDKEGGRDVYEVDRISLVEVKAS
jgi:hypothetical protein